jgi:hypothetical protein
VSCQQLKRPLIAQKLLFRTGQLSALGGFADGDNYSHPIRGNVTASSFYRLRASDEQFICFVIADPEPQEAVGALYGEGAVTQRHPGRPDLRALALADFLELK